MDLIEPTCPNRPENEDEAKHAIYAAIAAAVAELAKKKGIIIKQAECSGYRNPEGTIQFYYEPTKAVWDAYEKEEREYYIAKSLYEDQLEANANCVTLEVYREAKRKCNEYARKKCDSAETRDISFYIAKLNSEKTKNSEIIVV